MVIFYIQPMEDKPCNRPYLQWAMRSHWKYTHEKRYLGI